ncbi:hypothetical protein Srufu_063450 [Streptomyces libani subsp. rufus]|nr:hypothetical protein Srufu_063450 [Streptomyces libani subsp. rufus]
MSVRTSGITVTADGRRSEGLVGGQPPAPAGEPATLGTGLGLDPDDLPDGLVVADETGRVICFNAAAARITDIAPEDAVGRPSNRPCRSRTSRAAAGGGSPTPTAGSPSAAASPSAICCSGAVRCWSPPAMSAAARPGPSSGW